MATVHLGNVDNTTDALKIVNGPTQTALNLKANAFNPAISGAAAGLRKAMVQLGGVDNTTVALKVVSGPTQTALNSKANSADVFLKTDTYSRAQSEALFTYKIDTYTSPLRLVINPVTFATDVRIHPLMDLSVAAIVAGTISVTGARLNVIQDIKNTPQRVFQPLL
jgi:hypothetical protein